MRESQLGLSRLRCVSALLRENDRIFSGSGGWIHEDGKRVRYKVLSKSRPNRTLEVLVLQQGHARKALAHIEVPAHFPAGWLERWVRSLGTDLGSQFQEFDLRHIQTPEEWTQIATRLGWSSGRSTQA